MTDEPLLSAKTSDNQNSTTMSVMTFCPIGDRDVLQLKVHQLSQYPRVLKDTSHISDSELGLYKALQGHYSYTPHDALNWGDFQVDAIYTVK